MKRTKQELIDIAQGIYRGSIFTDRQLPMDSSIAQIVFMPLMFLPDEERKRLTPQVGMIYAEMCDAIGSRGINGYPMFGKCYLVNKEDATLVWKLYRKIKRSADLAALPFFKRLMAKIFFWKPLDNHKQSV